MSPFGTASHSASVRRGVTMEGVPSPPLAEWAYFEVIK